jgi:hypothetical protein
MLLVRWFFAIVAVVIVGAVFFGGYGGLQKLTGLLPSSGASIKNETASNLQGLLFLSLGTTSTTSPESTGLVPVVISVADGSARYVAADQLKSGPAITLQYSMSSDSSSAVFLATPIVVATGTTKTLATQQTPSIYSANTKGLSDYPSLLTALQNGQSISKPSDTDYFREFPVISPVKAILYSSIPKSVFTKSGTALDTLSTDSWNIYMIGTDGMKKMVTTGLHPKWIDTTHFAFLKNDGIYLYDLGVNSEKKVWNISHLTNIVTGFDVSDDGQFAAITDPANNSVQIIRVLNWSGTVLSSLAEIPVTATNPVFSPDDGYLAMIVLYQNPSTAQGARPVPVLRYYSLATQQFLTQSEPFDSASTNSIYMTDWR